MAGVPFIFGNATTSIPLSNLDANFNTGVTIGNTTVGLGNTVTTLGNVTLNNVTISSGTSNIAANANVVATTLTIGGVALGAGNSSTLKNRIINGAMVIDQRNAGASVTPTSGSYTLDRWNFVLSQTSKLTCQQLNASPPTGFTYYQGITSSSAYSITSSDYFQVNQIIEGYNIADLGWGTANAKTVTLSFWVQSSLTGTFGGSLRNYGVTRSYPFTYTISSANTWTQISVTIAGDTSGTWLTTNGWGIQVIFGLGCGSSFSGTAGAWASANYASATGATSVVGTSGATFYITGVQLEVGSSATGFEYRQYTTELSLCQRYLPAWIGAQAVQAQGQASSGTLAYIPLQYPVQARTAPTGLTSTSTSTIVSSSSGSGIAVSTLTFVQASNMSALVSATVSSGLTAGNASFLIFNNGNLLLTGCEL